MLVDYDNAFPPSSEITTEQVSVRFESWLRYLTVKIPALDLFEVRLYGGWYDSSDLSRRGSEVAALLPQLPQFPHAIPGRKILRGTIELAVAPMTAGDTPLLDTYRVRGSVPRLRLSRHPHPDNCARIDKSCPAVMLRSFTRHSNRSCPTANCELTTREVFVTHEQKMVDTMLTTDLLIAALDRDRYGTVVVISGDSDFVPPLMTARALSETNLIQLLPDELEASAYANQILLETGIEVLGVSQ